MKKHPALVGIVPRKNLWDIIQEQKWYHVPVESAPKNAGLVEFLGFYFPKVFGKEMRYKVNFYAKVRKVDIVKRIELFPEEKNHIRANKDYCLDFGIFCKNGDINLECDGEKYHTLPKALARDRERNNELTSFGWNVLRFTGKEINQTINNCFRIVEKTISNLGGTLDVQFTC